MKKILLSILVLSTSYIGISQTSCATTFDVLNNGGGGACPNTFAGNGIQSADANYKRDGLVEITFVAALGADVTPVITAIREVTSDPGDPVTTGPNLDIRFSLRQFNATRTQAEFCYFSPNNSNLFNGANARYQVDITYVTPSGNTSSSCVITEDPDPSPLPVKFESFSVSRSNANVSLTWSTSSEVNNDGFNVQKYINNGWKNISFIPSKANYGNSGVEVFYTYADVNNDKGISQYRIQQIDKDGKMGYSPTRTIRGVGMQKKVMLFPNPGINGKFNIVFEDSRSLNDVDVINTFGQVVKKYRSVVNSLSIENLSSGFYTIKITDRSSLLWSQHKILMK